MKKRVKGRPRLENPMVHTAVVLPRDLLERLRKDGQQSARGLSTEIRQRLLLTYNEAEQRDPETIQLTESIRMLAASIARDLGKQWHEDETAKQAFVAGLLELLIPEGVDRFRTFAEQYVLARASAFKPGTELEEAWQATQEARSIYRHIAAIGPTFDHKEGADTASPSETVKAAAPVSRPLGDPETIGRTHARLVMAARREARDAEEDR